MDSSGFSTSRFVRWFDHKYGVARQEHDWVKVHLMCGVRTNVVTAVEIRDRHAADTQIAALLGGHDRRELSCCRFHGHLV